MIGIRRFKASCIAAWVVACSGCGTSLSSSYPHRLMDQQGRTIHLEDILAVVDDDARTEAEKREALRDLGVGDEKLIDALLEL